MDQHSDGMSKKPDFRYPPGYHSRVLSRKSIIDGARESSSSEMSSLGTADIGPSLINQFQAMVRREIESSLQSVSHLPPGPQPTHESVHLSGSGQSLGKKDNFALSNGS